MEAIPTVSRQIIDFPSFLPQLVPPVPDLAVQPINWPATRRGEWATYRMAFCRKLDRIGRLAMASEAEEDDRSFIDRTCFVIMPFGEKIDLKNAPPSAAGAAPVQAAPGTQMSVIDFDGIFRRLSKPASIRRRMTVSFTTSCPIPA
jgi:hypothetical protein